MSRGSTNLYTMWTPFGDVSVEMGTLAVCEGSNRLEGFVDLYELKLLKFKHKTKLIVF